MLPPGTETLIANALQEDIGEGDHSTLATIPANSSGAARLLVKDSGVIAGVELAEAIAHHLDPDLTLRVYILDGASVNKGDVAFNILGSARSILTVERVLLNYMQRMSGIATLTSRFVNAVEGTGCKVLDTRKTTPGLRESRNNLRVQFRAKLMDGAKEENAWLLNEAVELVAIFAASVKTAESNRDKKK